MPDIIQLLPDHLANQIAAGEVIQRPASVVKELLENAIDAGAADIQLIIKDAGKEVVQVVDNGKGMSTMDARMSFERHATSKIKRIDDLFAIRTMGFRGEALASIAAVAQVEMKTRMSESESGTLLIVEASQVIRQEPAGMNNGTSIAVKNLFYNVPARRKFLKSNTSEYKHIVDEFTRIAVAYPATAFRLFNNNVQQFHLSAGNLKNRIIELLGGRMEKQLLPLQLDTDVLKIHGFIGKPEAATRARGNQYFFINNRFIRNAYLNHAISQAYEGLIDKDAYPFYVLFFEMDPQSVDVNVHPSKQEVKFDDEKMLYAYLQSAVKLALAQNNVSPSLDFSLDGHIQQLESLSLPQSGVQKERAASGYLQQSFSEHGKAFFIDKKESMKEWQQQREAFFPSMPLPETPDEASGNTAAPEVISAFEEEHNLIQPVIQWREYLISTMKSGLLLVHHSYALDRIRYERMMQHAEQHKALSQQLLFPSVVEVSPRDAHLFEGMLGDLRDSGFHLTHLGGQSYSVNGIPPECTPGEEQQMLEGILEDVKNEVQAKTIGKREAVIQATVRRSRKPKSFSQPEAQGLIDELFSCQQPQYTPDGKKIFTLLPLEQIQQLFTRI